jgi:hypothetical protein
MYIGVDFDGTCVTHEYPNVGKDIGAVPILKKLVEAGHKLILFTMRSDVDNVPIADNEIKLVDNFLTDTVNMFNERKLVGNFLTDAVNWFKENNIELCGINENPTQKYWTTSPKAYAQLYIDDAALGCPLTYDVNLSDRYFVDWKEIEKNLKIRGLINMM